MDDNEKLLKEWEKRYDSYIAYRNQYFNTLNIVVIIIGVSLSVAFGSEKPSYYLINFLFIMDIIVLLTLFYAHIIVQRFFRSFSFRITEIEKELGIHKFEMIILLKQAVLFTKYVSLLGALIILILLGLYDFNIIAF